MEVDDETVQMETINSIRDINHNLKLIEEMKMNQKIEDMHQQQRCIAFGQLQIKVWDPRGSKSLRLVELSHYYIKVTEFIDKSL